MEGGRELSGNHTSYTRLIVSSDSGLFCGVTFAFGMGRSVKKEKAFIQMLGNQVNVVVKNEIGGG